ncbi:hypothetical protein DY000_02039939 [Brassica cretica]|uniref:Uncharacterized protein n=1 Tax=Brassica cretica TaxID=69181 RepID=A0ABQ7BN73_BRACR|nr:hypothetical protein DY000_02039939 [Brassica cretica]
MRKTSSPSQKPIDFEKPSKNYRKETKITIYYPLTFVTFVKRDCSIRLSLKSSPNLVGRQRRLNNQISPVKSPKSLNLLPESSNLSPDRISLAGSNLSRRIESLAGSNLSRRNVDQFGDFEI